LITYNSKKKALIDVTFAKGQKNRGRRVCAGGTNFSRIALKPEAG